MNLKKLSIIFIFINILLCSCSSRFMKIEMTSTNNLIELPSYSFKVPVNETWYLAELSEELDETVVFKSVFKKHDCEISLAYLKLENDNSTIEQFVSEFRESNKSTIINQYNEITEPDDKKITKTFWRFLTGYYKVSRDLKDDIITINSKDFYNIASYKIDGIDNITKNMTILLHFPYPDKSTQFIMATFKESYPTFDKSYQTITGRQKDYFDTFQSLLKTLNLKKVEIKHQ